MLRWFCKTGVAAVLLGVGGCGWIMPAQRADLSAFEKFRVEPYLWMGLCMPEDSVYSATIRHEEDGSYIVELAILDEVLHIDKDDDCPVDTRPGDDISQLSYVCPDLRELPARELTDSEVERMLDLFSDVRIVNGLVAPILIGWVVDPCMWTYYSWDEFEVSDLVMQKPHMRADQVQELQDFLEELRTD